MVLFPPRPPSLSAALTADPGAEVAMVAAVAQASSCAIPLAVIRHPSWAALCERFAPSVAGAAPAATPFQRGNWLQAWYDTLGAQPGITPLPLEICNAETGAPLLGAPLVVDATGTQKLVRFADAALTDYNAPLLGQAFLSANAKVSGSELQRVLSAELRGCDQIRFSKMPQRLGQQINPFTELPGHTDSLLGTNIVHVGDDWPSYRKRLAKKVRKELERSFRVFQRDGSNARFRVVRDAGEAVDILQKMELLQAERMRELGLPYLLNEPQYAAFYRRLLELDLSNGRLLLTVLSSDPDELVGALLGLVDGERYAMVRLAHAGSSWSHCSPGKLIIDQTMAHLHQRGVTQFDFTTGEYSYKRGFLTESEPLVDVALGLSMAGRVQLQRERLIVLVKEGARRYPNLYNRVKSMVGSQNGSSQGT